MWGGILCGQDFWCRVALSRPRLAVQPSTFNIDNFGQFTAFWALSNHLTKRQQSATSRVHHLVSFATPSRHRNGFWKPASSCEHVITPNISWHAPITRQKCRCVPFDCSLFHKDKASSLTMSTRHYFPSTAANTLVPRALRALTTANPHLSLDEPHRVVSNKHHDPSNVSIIGGGGSGHEPAWSGYVGDGLLSAAACGDIFASPSASQVLAAMEAAPSEQGTILLITNYTGDRLHFGLAAEKARANAASSGQHGNGKIAIVAATDDVSIGRSKCAKVGRRGLPGHIFSEFWSS